jgi:hypothetical protein
MVAFGGGVAFRPLVPSFWMHAGDIDRGTARGPPLVGLMGVGCVLAYASMVVAR